MPSEPGQQSLVQRTGRAVEEQEVKAMPQTITRTVTLYQYHELSEKAKERARDWYREVLDDPDWADYAIEDAVRIGEILGISVGTRPVQLMNGKTRQEPDVYWSLDRGAYVTFSGRYEYRKGSVGDIAEEASQDVELHRIAKVLRDLQRPYFYGVTASISHGRHDVIEVEITDCNGEWVNDVTDTGIKEALRDFAAWVLSQLQSEWEYVNSDEYAAEGIEANEYTFNEDGEREN